MKAPSPNQEKQAARKQCIEYWQKATRIRPYSQEKVRTWISNKPALELSSRNDLAINQTVCFFDQGSGRHQPDQITKTFAKTDFCQENRSDHIYFLMISTIRKRESPKNRISGPSAKVLKSLIFEDWESMFEKNLLENLNLGRFIAWRVGLRHEDGRGLS